MSVEDLPDLRPPRYGDVIDPQRPILSFAWEAPGPHRAAAHAHPRAHIIQPTRGALWAVTPEGRWLVPTHQALWIPPHVHHDVYSQAAAAARMIFVDPAFSSPLPDRAGTVLVSPLLAQLLPRALGYGNDYPADGPAARLARVMLDELAALEVAPFLLPGSGDHRLARVMERLRSAPGAPTGLAELAHGTGASARTLARLFKAETGMTFRDWRTRLHLMESIERLARGATVTEVALDLGYASTSSFVYMFRSHLGVPPGRYSNTRG